MTDGPDTTRLAAAAPVNRTLFQQYPPHLRQLYAAAVQDQRPEGRHARLMKLGEGTLAYLGSVAFSDYRGRRHLDPDPKIEAQLSSLRKLSLGHFLQLFRASTETMQPALFDYKSRAETEGSDAIGRFFGAYAAIEDAIALEAQNLRRLVAQRVETARAAGWLAFWEKFVEYRNRAEGHSTTYQWPIGHPDYYALVTPLLEAALVDAITAPHVERVFAEHPTGILRDIHYDGQSYIHEVAGDDLGLPFDVAIALDRSVLDIWNQPGWKATVGGSLLLTKLPSGALEIAGLYHDLLADGPPQPLGAATPETPRIVVASVAKTSPWRSGQGVAYGTCGELVQGFTGEGEPFHVTCPIQKSATVNLHMRSAPEVSVTQAGPGLHKLEQALLRTAALLELEPLEMRVDHWSDLDIGKGMGSSTADIVAAARAVAAVAERDLTTEQLARIATQIESSDGSMYPGIVAFNQKNGHVLREFEWWPQFVVCMVVPTQVFNTESANFTGKQKLGREFDEILDQLDKAVANRDAATFAACATRSGQLNQRFVPNPVFALLVDKAGDFGAAGVNVGHTGTVVGLLFDADDPAAMQNASMASIELQRSLPPGARVEITMTPPPPGD